MPYSELVVPALYVTLVIGPMQIACVVGFFLMRHRPVFLIRVPKVVLGCMTLKLISFFLISWLFLDPDCPCVVNSVMFWLDGTGTMVNVFRKVILLFRYEIQDAVEKSKQGSTLSSFDDNNFFVRYRQVLAPRTQAKILVGMGVYVAVPMLIVTAIWHDLAAVPCTTDVTVHNKLVLTTILLTWATVFIPAVLSSLISTRRLKRFPNDNWKMGIESGIASQLAMLAGVCCALVLGLVPTFDGFLFLLLTFSILVQAITFLMPLHLHRKTVSQLANMDIRSLTSLKRLLLERDFLAGFDAFLKKEFSSENLFFWQSVNVLLEKYGVLLLEDGQEHYQATVAETLLMQAATDCINLGQQCVGDQAPCQVNISGFTDQDLRKAIGNVSDLVAQQDKSTQSEHQLRLAVEKALKTLVVAQEEVYDGLQKDPYPRFLLTAACKQLNKNDHLKRLLAAEKLEGDMKRNHSQNQDQNPNKSHSSSSDGSAKSKRSSMGLATTVTVSVDVIRPSELSGDDSTYT